MHHIRRFDSAHRPKTIKKQNTMKTIKTMNVIFAVIFALCALMALSAVIFCNALHQLPVFAFSALMAWALYTSDKETEKQQ
jgi:Co/Zn/Cd efflux system component